MLINWPESPRAAQRVADDQTLFKTINQIPTICMYCCCIINQIQVHYDTHIQYQDNWNQSYLLQE